MIYYTGDIHGSAKGIVAFAQHYELTESDIIVILGDVGANYYGDRRDRYCKDALARIKPTVFCIHGNHERRPDTLAGYKQKEWNGGLVWYEDEYPNLLFARDGDIFTRNRCRAAGAGNRGAKALWPHAGRSRCAVLRILCRPKDTGSCDYTSQKVERGTGSSREE